MKIKKKLIYILILNYKYIKIYFNLKLALNRYTFKIKKKERNMKRNFISPWNHITQEKILNFNFAKFPYRDYKIVHISDTHLGYYLNINFLENLIDRVIEINPDICIITGDLISAHKNFSIDILSPLKRLTKKIDTYFTVGNHEVALYKDNIELFLKELRDLGVYTLHNQSIVVNGKFNLIGVGEYNGVRYGYPVDIESSFKNIDTALPSIVLVHRPNLIKLFKDRDFMLALSGHNHGGQITKLGLLSSIIRNEYSYLMGKIELEDNKFIYISNGVGYSRVPIRLFAPSEMAIININRK